MNRKLRAYVAFDRRFGPHEGAILVFAHTAKEARRMAWPETRSWLDTEWVDMAVRWIKSGAEQHREKDGPHVVAEPETCMDCLCWFAEPLDGDGRCEGCAETAAEMAMEETV